jgi:hypothetical protein
MRFILDTVERRGFFNTTFRQVEPFLSSRMISWGAQKELVLKMDTKAGLVCPEEQEYSVQSQSSCSPTDTPE